MFGAKLFSIAAVVIAAIALVPIKLTDNLFDFYVHGTYFVVAPRHVILGFALLCGVFAGFYYFGDLFLGHRLNNGLSLAHFLLWTSSIVVLILAARGLGYMLRARQDPTQSWALLVGLVAPVLAFIVGAALFLVNLAMAIVLKSKAS